MAQDNRSVDQRYIDQTKGQQDRLAQTHEDGSKRYNDLRAASDAAYETMKTEARINKALSDLAGGPASSSMTHRQRSESALRNEIGGTERQQQDYSKEIDLALKNLDTQYAADKAYTDAINNALRSAEKVKRSQFDAELGLKRNEYELDKSGSTFDQMYQLYLKRMVDKNAFKDATGYAVKAMPSTRRTVKKQQSTTMFVGGKAPEKNTHGYETVVVYSVWSGIPTYYEVKTDTAKVLKEKGVSLQDKNGHIKSEPELYAITYYEGFAGASYAEQQRILTEHADDFTEQFGSTYYDLINGHLQNMAGAGQYYSTADKTVVENAYSGMLNAAEGGSEESFLKAVEIYNTAVEKAGKNLADKHSDDSDWKLYTSIMPGLNNRFSYGEGEDESAFVGLPPKAFTPEAFAEYIEELWGFNSYNMDLDVLKRQQVLDQMGNVELDTLTTDQLNMFTLSIKLYEKFDVLVEYDRSTLGFSIIINGEYCILSKISKYPIFRGYDSYSSESNIFYNFKALDEVIKSM